jgi:hypothetical protein
MIRRGTEAGGGAVGRRNLTVLAAVTVMICALGSVLANPVAAKSSKHPKLVFSGALKGKSKAGVVNCTQSTQTKGLQLGVSLNNFKVAGSKNSNLSMVFAGPNYAPGDHDFGGFTSASTGVQVTFSYGAGKSWSSGEGTGTATLNADKKSGKIDGDLLEGSGIAPTGGPEVHVKGTFQCGKIVKL